METEVAAFTVVLFDWEGTLVDFQWNLEAATAQAKTELARLGLPPGSLPDHYALLRNEAVQLAAQRGLDRKELVRRIDAVYDRFDSDALTRWSLRPGVQALLLRLQARRVKLGLVSNVGRMTIEPALARFDLVGIFGAVVTRNDVDLMKPCGEGIQRALKKLGAAPSEALFVGDSVSDILAAKDARVRVAIVEGGESTPESLNVARPTFLWATLGELEKASPSWVFAERTNRRR